MNPIIDKFGNKHWLNENGLHHRKDGPALIYWDLDEEWFINGELHRENGPALEYHDVELWYYHDEHIECSCQEEFEKIIKLRMFW